MSEHLYDEGTSTFGMETGYRLKVETDHGAEDPRTWGDHVTTGDYAHTQWANGDVYTVVVQREVTYVNRDDDRDTLTVWKDVDDAVLGGCYLTATDTDEGVSRYSALDVAREHGWPGVKPVQYRVERIDKFGDRTHGPEKPTIEEAFAEVAHGGMSTRERHHAVCMLALRSRTGYRWTDYVLHRQGEGA